jgi:hypothetical protein
MAMSAQYQYRRSSAAVSYISIESVAVAAWRLKGMAAVDMAKSSAGGVRQRHGWRNIIIESSRNGGAAKIMA